MFPSSTTSSAVADMRNGRPGVFGPVESLFALRIGWTLSLLLWVPMTAWADFGTLHDAASAALETGRILASPLSCREEVQPGFSETPRGAILVGFDIALGQEGVSGLRPIYRIPTGYYSTRGLGVFASGTENKDFVIQVRAKPGYAVGAVRLRQSDAVRAVNLVYRRVRDDDLDLEDAYESGWAGNTKVGVEVVLEGHGAAIVGITAPAEGSDRVPGLGLQCLVSTLNGDRPSATTFLPNGSKETRYAPDPADQATETEAIPRRVILISLVMFGLVMLPVLLAGIWFLASRGLGSRRRAAAGTATEPGQAAATARQPRVSDPLRSPRPPEIRVRFRRSG